MKGILVVVFIFFTLEGFSQTIKVDPCSIKGTIFIESTKSKANFSVYVDENSPSVDLMVHKVERKLYADRPGLWHITEDRTIADYIVYIERNRAGANLTIQFTPTESFAGCTKN